VIQTLHLPYPCELEILSVRKDRKEWVDGSLTRARFDNPHGMEVCRSSGELVVYISEGGDTACRLKIANVENKIGEVSTL